jgi:elongation factor G
LAKGAIPDEFVQPIASGIREGLEYGIDGAPIVDVTVRILDGTWHQIDSSELAFKLAGIFAAKDAFKMAEPVIVDESS